MLRPGCEGDSDCSLLDVKTRFQFTANFTDVCVCFNYFWEQLSAVGKDTDHTVNNKLRGAEKSCGDEWQGSM